MRSKTKAGGRSPGECPICGRPCIEDRRVCTRQVDQLLGFKTKIGDIVYIQHLKVPFSFYHMTFLLLYICLMLTAYASLFYSGSLGNPLSLAVYPLVVVVLSGLQELANKFSDPYGRDETDLNPDALITQTYDEVRCLCFQGVNEGRFGHTLGHAAEDGWRAAVGLEPAADNEDGHADSVAAAAAGGGVMDLGAHPDDPEAMRQAILEAWGCNVASGPASDGEGAAKPPAAAAAPSVACLPVEMEQASLRAGAECITPTAAGAGGGSGFEGLAGATIDVGKCGNGCGKPMNVWGEQPRPETPDPEEEEGAEPPDVASLSLDQLLNAVSDSVPSARGSTSGTPAGA
mmetsp:Transcript_85826/g.228780  ORF Transcript_85826/g.228780 Transcript_85826/m.228780 type:complete len:345 (+) Transcript_85826:138-1172(+)